MKKKIRARGYRTMAEIMAELPSTINQITEKLGCLRCTVSSHMNTLRALGLVHRKGIDMSSRGRPVIWDIGRGEAEIEHPRSVERTKRFVRMAVQFKVGVTLLEEPLTVSQLAEEMGMHKASVGTHFLAALRNAGLVLIAGWEPSGNNWAPQWVFGKGTNKPKPTPMPRSQQNARYRERAKQLKMQKSVNDALFRKAA